MTKQQARDLWSEALESGEYEQGRNFLYRNGKYCCFGVAEMLAMDHGVIPVREIKGLFPSYEVMKWLGLADRGGRYEGKNRSLAKDNDVELKTFREIAAIIRSNPPGLFVEGE